MTDELDIELCEAEPGNPEVELNTCVREKDHDGEHYFWCQVPWGDGSRTYGLQIYNTELKSIWMLEVDGKFSEGEVAATVAILIAYSERRKG